jgi:ferric-dicitrate binding protein FerR (iron transport regulator)
MKAVEDYIEVLIAKYLSAEANADERGELMQWVNADQEHAKYFEESKRLFAAIETNAVNWSVNVDQAWRHLDGKNEEDAKVISLWSRPLFVRAAAAIVVIGLAVFLYSRLNQEPPVLLSINSSAKIFKSSLPDGSAVTLNTGASLNYSMRKGHRHVELTGEAYFAVEHDSLQPFEIQAGDLLIEDIGTAFNVKAPADGKIEISVDEGEVMVSRKGLEPLSLKAGEAAIYDPANGTLHKITIVPTENLGAYATKDFDFSGVKLSEIIRQINSAYGTDIRLDHTAPKNCLYSVSFHDEDIDMIVSVIAETLGMQIEKQGSSILLKGGSCQ